MVARKQYTVLAFSNNTGFIPFRWINLLRFGHDPHPQINLIDEAMGKGNDVYYLHLSSKSGDGGVVLPFEMMSA